MAAIKVYKSIDLGAPSLTGQSGSLVALLDATLVNGYGEVVVTSITRDSSIATAVCANPHGLNTDDTALLSGVTETDYNGEKKVTVINATTFSFAVANTPTTPATGTIKVKRAPGGFNKVFSGANKAVYRANDIAGLRHYLRVDDGGGSSGGTREARIASYESMTDVDTGVGRSPTIGQSSDGYYFTKSNNFTADNRSWCLITNGKLFYLFSEFSYKEQGGWLPVTGYFYAIAFGDINSYKTGDQYASIITGGTTPNSTTNPYQGLSYGASSLTAASSFSQSINIARDFTGIAGSKFCSLMGCAFGTQMGGQIHTPYPHAVDNGFYMVPVLITQTQPNLIRGVMPGAYESIHGPCLNNGDTVENVQGLTGRKLMMLYVSQASNKCSLMIDITGPWE